MFGLLATKNLYILEIKDINDYSDLNTDRPDIRTFIIGRNSLINENMYYDVFTRKKYFTVESLNKKGVSAVINVTPVFTNSPFINANSAFNMIYDLNNIYKKYNEKRLVRKNN